MRNRRPFISQILNRAKFWEQEYSLTALLIMLALMLFVVTPLASSAKIGSGIVLCFIAVLTITGVATVTGHRGLIILVILLAVSGIVLDWAAHLASDLWLRMGCT